MVIPLAANARDLERELEWFAAVLDARLRLYFGKEPATTTVSDLAPPDFGDSSSCYARFIREHQMTFAERLVLVLALIPHVRPQLLDVLWCRNEATGRGFTEFGGVQGATHGGFIPTGETAAFILAGDDLATRFAVTQLFESDHCFARDNVLHLAPVLPGESLLSGALAISRECRHCGCDVYRIDLSMIASKYIGETEKNLARIFDLAEHKRWILFFDEADALFGKRTKVDDAHDRYANQEISFLLQRLEDYHGVVILASNFKGNIDDAFLRRFQSVVHFPLPKPAERLRIWKNAFSPKAVLDDQIDLEKMAEKYDLAAGAPLPLTVRRFMEPRFRADFSNVRVHTGDKPAQLNRQLNARAFALGNHLFFGKDRFQPETGEGRELIAHELTHTLQQGATVQRSEDATVTQQTAPHIQRLGLRDALNYFADQANHIPGFRMFTLILGTNPINLSRVERSAANILRALVEFIPGGHFITKALDNYGIFDRVGAWVEQQIAALGMTAGLIRQAIDKFLDSLSWTDIFDLGGVWNRAKRIVTEPINRLLGFARGLLTGILRFIKDAILRPLAGLAEGTRGYDLLKAVLGQDPITGDPYPRTAETLIGGFMRLIGQEEVWANLQRARAVPRAWAWFQGMLGGLLGFVRQIPSVFLQALQSLELMDIVVLPRAFAKVARVFERGVGPEQSLGIESVRQFVIDHEWSCTRFMPWLFARKDDEPQAGG